MRRGAGPEGGPRPLHRPGKGVERGGCVLVQRSLGCWAAMGKILHAWLCVGDLFYFSLAGCFGEGRNLGLVLLA